MKRLFLALLFLASPCLAQSQGFGFFKSSGTPIEISTDSLKLYLEFHRDRGFGFSTYAQLMPSLYVDGTRNGDTLQLGTTSGSESSDPTDSTAFGGIYCDGSNDGLKTTQNFYMNTDFTIVIKMKGYATGYMFSNHYTSIPTNGVLIYTSTGNSINIGANAGEYYSNWLIKGDDSTTILDSEGDLFRGGVLRVNNGYTSWTPYTALLYFACIKFAGSYVKCFIESIAVYNKKLTTPEKQMWDN